MPLARRKRLILKWAAIGCALAAGASLAVFTMKPDAKPYRPGESVAGVTNTLERDLPEGYPLLRFREVSREAGLDFRHFHGERSVQLPEDMGSGGAWGDYDGDGDLDLYLCNIAGPLTMTPAQIAASPAGNRLYRNEGGGAFRDVTASSGTGFKGVSMGAAWGDYDSDRDLDLFVSNYGRNLLFRNQGDGTFAESGRESGVTGPEGFWTGASWADYDADGDLDLYVCGYVKYSFDPADANKSQLQYNASVPFTLNPSSYPPERNLLYRNDGRGRFVEAGRESGLDNTSGRSLSASWCDYDGDGLLDLYVANDISDNAMFRNLGGGRFEDVSHQAAVSDYRGAMGLATGDWDNDGDLDIFISHWIAQENALFSNMRFAFGITDVDPHGMSFFDIADQVGLGQIALDYVGWGTFFFDYDNDSRPDLFVANGSTFQSQSEPKRLIGMRDLLFWNAGEEEGFFETGQASGEVFERRAAGRGASFADYDGDGDVDILVVNHSGPAWLLRNEGGHQSHWLGVRLRADQGNTFGLGALVSLKAGATTQTQQMGCQSSYLFPAPYQLHFGLGEAARVDELTVRFPSGVTRRLTDVAADRTLTVREEEP